VGHPPLPRHALGGAQLRLRAVPEAHRRRALAGLDLGSWRLAFNGAEAVSPDTVRASPSASPLRPAARGDGAGLRPGRGDGRPAVSAARARPADRPRRPRGARAKTGARCPRPPTTPARAALRRLRAAPARGTRPHRRRDGREPGERIEGRLEFRGPRPPAATSATPGRPRAVPRRLARHRRPRLPRRRRGLRHRPGQGHRHPRRPQPLSAGDRGGGGAVEGVRKGCVAVFGSPTPPPAPSAWWCWPRPAAGAAASAAPCARAVIGASRC
jgi:hypothetical protein